MLKTLKQSLLDEDSQGSSPRTQSLALSLLGAVVALVGLILVACGLDVATYATGIVALCFGTAATKTVASQAKSARIKIAKVDKVKADVKQSKKSE